MRLHLFRTFGWTMTILATASAAAQEFTISLRHQNQTLVGMPVHWDSQVIQFLGRDGALWQFSPDSVSDVKKVSDGFSSLTQSELKSQLVEEFGKSFDVSGTGTYLVVHPVGQRDLWAPRFEDLYRSMVHYFTARRVSMEKPKFPLIAVVLPSQSQFINYARQLGINDIDGSTKGLYHIASNRILVFDNGDSQGGSDWQMNYSVVIHEAAHQTAYNTGIHNRFGTTPAWVAEGIGTVFEAPGVYDPRRYPQQSDRINRYRFEMFRQQLPSRPAETLSFLIRSDKLFDLNWQVAYANAWALTFYLTDREPAKYAEYLRNVTNRAPDDQYTPDQRLADFQQVFGSDLKMFDVRLVRFIESLSP